MFFAKEGGGEKETHQQFLRKTYNGVSGREGRVRRAYQAGEK